MNQKALDKYAKRIPLDKISQTRDESRWRRAAAEDWNAIHEGSPERTAVRAGWSLHRPGRRRAVWAAGAAPGAAR